MEDVYRRLANLPECAKDRTFATFKVYTPSLKAALGAAQAVAIGKLRWLTMLGERDRGKSHLAMAICQEWLALGLFPRYMVVSNLLNWLREGYAQQEGVDSYPVRFAFLCRVPLLVLDDLGLEKATEFTEEQLTAIVAYRYDHLLPLVVTSNKALTDYEHIPERIASRLQRMESGRVLVLDTPQEYKDYRRR